MEPEHRLLRLMAELQKMEPIRHSNGTVFDIGEELLKIARTALQSSEEVQEIIADYLDNVLSANLLADLAEKYGVLVEEYNAIVKESMEQLPEAYFLHQTVKELLRRHLTNEEE